MGATTSGWCLLFTVFEIVKFFPGINSQSNVYIPPGQQYGLNYPQNPNYYQYGYGANPQQPNDPYYRGYPEARTFRTPSLYASNDFITPTINEPTDVSVSTGLGTVIGKKVFLFDGPEVHFLDRPGTTKDPVAKHRNTVLTFLGIPYAKAPIGDKRFQPPESYGPFVSYTADRYKASCQQPQQPLTANDNFLYFSEDCLFLNIFTPSTNDANLPVMIYIHGGEFEYGSGQLFPGHMLAASQNVIVVTFNYRLGPLGFLSTGDAASPGNYGMLDQVMAIRWVYDHIQSFRGDNRKITLFGPGAGGASAGLHLLSPLTKGFYIRRVIAQSGSALADWATFTNVEKARNTSRVFGHRMGCTTDSSSKLVDCLKKRSAKELCNTNIQPDIGFFPWAPVVDKDLPVSEENKFLPDTPLTLISSRFFNPNIEYLSGVTRDEAAYMLLKDFSLINNNFQITQEYFNGKIKDYIKQYNYTLNPEGIFQAMSFMYTHWADPYQAYRIREEYINMMSDAFFKSPNDKIVKILVNRGVRTFMYVLNTTVEGMNWPNWRAVAHDTELYFLSGAPFMERKYFPPSMLQLLKNEKWTEGDRHMSRFFMETFANFARTGAPIQTPLFGITWKQMQKQPERVLYYLNINTTLNSTMNWDYRQLECSFWSQYLPMIIGPVPTLPPIPMDQDLEFQIGFYSVIGAAALFFLLTIIMCCLYCRAMTLSHRDIYYEDNIIPEDNYSQNTTELIIKNNQKNGKYEKQQHTTV